MSRKAREEQSCWKLPSFHAFVGDYGPFRTKGYEPIQKTLIWLCCTPWTTNNNNSNKESRHHDMVRLAGHAQQTLLLQQQQNEKKFQTILVLNVKNMFETKQEYQQAQEKEMEQPHEVSKHFGKLLLRLLQRLLLHQVVVAAHGEFLCLVVLKLYRAIQTMDAEMISELWLIHPQQQQLEAMQMYMHNNTTTRGKNKRYPVKLHIVVSSKQSCSDSSTELLQRYFEFINVVHTTEEKEEDHDNSNNTTNWFHVIAGHGPTNNKHVASTTNDEQYYDPNYCNEMGKMLFMSRIKVEMNRYTKQYERICQDVTSEIMELIPVQEETKEEEEEVIRKDGATNNNITDWSKCERHVGALILRGNRCVLVRSLTQQWKGMRIPSVVPKAQESPVVAAIRAVVQYTEVEATQVEPLPHVMPVAVYGPNKRPILIELHPLYATDPPPDGPLEDADMEDEETLYDWYTFSNAIAKLLQHDDDKASVAALHTMAMNLMQAANVGLVPAKWGGVFGQELMKMQQQQQQQTQQQDTTTPSSMLLLEAKVEEWTPSRRGDVLQNVRRATHALQEQQFTSRKDANGHRTSKLPVTLLSGFLGSGKTTLLSHILTNYQGLKVAILVNDMGDVNIDAALIKSNAVSVTQREEHMVELSNGCICCTLREDLLVEVANIAADASFDYLLIESSGVSEPMPVAETFTFEDSTGLRLGDVAEIDTLVTVVDGSRFMNEMQSLESLRGRNWHADAQDERTISHLLCDQVEFANVIVLNKVDLMKKQDKVQVMALIQEMNPTARLLESEYSNVPLDSVLGTGLFSMSEAEKHQGWLQEARIGEHTPETKEYGIGSFTYRATRPFLPDKLHDLLESLLNRSQPPFDTSNVLRAKGFMWLASCSQLQGDFSLAGSHYSLLPGNPWWAEIDKSHWPENLERDIAPLWHEPYGDRQQEVVFIGQSLDKNAIWQALDNCLVSVESMAVGQEVWDKIIQESHGGDPYQATWDEAIALAQQQQEADHDHSHEHDHNHSQQTGILVQ